MAIAAMATAATLMLVWKQWQQYNFDNAMAIPAMAIPATVMV